MVFKNWPKTANFKGKWSKILRMLRLRKPRPTTATTETTTSDETCEKTVPDLGHDLFTPSIMRKDEK